eukprot:257680-Pelagomonas_calceolata.AAC.7
MLVGLLLRPPSSASCALAPHLPARDSALASCRGFGGSKAAAACRGGEAAVNTYGIQRGSKAVTACKGGGAAASGQYNGVCMQGRGRCCLKMSSSQAHTTSKKCQVHNRSESIKVDAAFISLPLRGKAEGKGRALNHQCQEACCRKKG